MEFDLSASTTHFKKGEQLRLYLPLWAWVGGSSNIWGGYGSDPQGRADTDTSREIIAPLSGASTTKLQLHVPIKLNV